MLSENELVELKTNTTITVSQHSEWPTTNTAVFATNTLGSYNRVFGYKFSGDNTLVVPVGKYKFYAINRNSAYDYENIDFGKLPIDSLYYGDVIISCKTDEYKTNDEGLKKVLSGKYVARSSGEIFADSTMLVNVELGQNTKVTFQKPYKLTTQYTVSGNLTSSRAAQNVYVEICDIVAKKKPNGAVVGGKRTKCVLSVGGASKDTKRTFEQNMIVLGLPKQGTANVYVRFKGDDQSTTPEQKSVQYTVKDGIVNLGDITF